MAAVAARRRLLLVTRNAEDFVTHRNKALAANGVHAAVAGEAIFMPRLALVVDLFGSCGTRRINILHFGKHS